jgi:hypothetical protein
MPPAPAALLNESHAAFIQSGLAIDVASHEAGYVPVVARAAACRVSPDRRQVTILLSAARNRRFLDAVTSSGAIAAVFGHPGTLETIQLKGADAAVVPADATDVAVVTAEVDAFVAAVDSVGGASALARRELRIDAHSLAAVTFTIAAAFVQTPGPAAGSRI